MTERERFIQSLTFAKPDKVTFQPGGPRESTLARWRQEGLPKNTDYLEFVGQCLGFSVPRPTAPIDPGISFRMIPEFPERILEHRDGHYIVQDWSGGIVEIADQFDVTYLRFARDFVTRKWHKFPVETLEDWTQMKARYAIAAEGRFPVDFTQRCQALRERDYPVTIAVSGPFWQLREWCGLENLCIMMVEQPEFVEEMATFWGQFVATMLDTFLPDFVPDSLLVQEDMAYKAHSMISPEMAYRFLMPIYQMWLPRLQKANCPVFDLDSDGYIADLLPLWVEAGFNCCSPMEVAAGNDIVHLRKQYGQKMAFRGGIDKRAIAQGGRVIAAEVHRVVPPLLADGGFIPGCDHGVPHDISWPDFLDYTRLLARLTGWIA